MIDYLKTKYKAAISFENENSVMKKLKVFSSYKIAKLIEFHVIYECTRKFASSFSTEFMPGLYEYLYDKYSNFHAQLDHIQSNISLSVVY